MKKLIFGCVLFSSLVIADGFTLTSDVISGQLGNEQVLNGFGCKGDNISPKLSWGKAPHGTKSFAVTMYDPDAPTGSGWWHWVIFDIPSDTTSIARNSGDVSLNLLPQSAIQSITDFGKSGYGGACPPIGHGAHKYIFTVYALDVEKLGLDVNASPALVGFMINSHTLAKASIIAYYGR